MIAAVALAGCAAQPRAADGPSPDDPAWLAPVSARAAREDGRRLRPVQPPPGVDATRLAPADDQRAQRPIAEARDAVTPSDLAPSPQRSADQIPERAMRLYAAGRAKLVAGDAQAAIEDLRGAVEIDDASASAWRALGEAYLESGNMLAGHAAHREAVKRDPTMRRSLVRLGLHAASRRDWERAASLLARVDIDAEIGDPAEPYLVADALGRSLLELGYTRAGRDLLRAAADLPERFSRPTVFGRALSALYRSRGERWREVGDASARLEEYEAALDAYARSADLPSFDPGALTPRRAYAALRLGREATAARFVLLEADQRDGRVEQGTIDLIRYVADESGMDGAMAAALERLLESLPQRQRAAAAGRIALARAAALPADRAAAVLRDRLAEAPEDSEALSALLRRTGAESEPQRALREAAALIERSPLNADRYVDALRRAGLEVDALLAAWPDRRRADDPAWGLLRARLLMKSDRFDEAERTLTDLVDADRRNPATLATLAELLSSQGRVDEAASVADQIDAEASLGAKIAKAEALARIGDYDRAVDLLAEAAERDDAPAAVPITLGRLLARLGRHERASEWFQRAVDRDPLAEAAYAGLIELHGPNGPLPDRARLSEVARALRDAIPSARSLRWLRAQELIANRQYGAAERELLELAEEQPEPGVVRALVSVWLATGSADRAEQWLRDKARARPDDPAIAAELARVLADSGQAEQAAELLRGWLERRPGDAAISVRLERILREQLGRPSEADRLAMRRLEGARRSLPAALELAEIHLRQGDPGLAAERLLDALAGAEVSSPQQREALAQLAARTGADAQDDPDQRALAIELADAVAERLDKAPNYFHRVRVGLLTRDGARAERVLDALAAAAQDVPEDAADLVFLAAANAYQAERHEDALRLAEGGVALLSQPDVRALRVWLAAAEALADLDSAERLLAYAVDNGLAERLAEETLGARNLTSQRDAAAEIAYVLASAAAVADSPDTRRFYRLTLRFNPDHPMANNNLGYDLLTSGGDIAEAERLIERAYRGAPDSAAVVDSLGWVRYKRGVLFDEINPDGEVVRQGALTLLERAVEIGRETRDNGLVELHQHYGDALWRAGERENAVEQWRLAEQAAQRLRAQVAELPQSFLDVIDGVEARLRAVENDQPPPVEPVASAPAEAPADPPTMPAPSVRQ